MLAAPGDAIGEEVTRPNTEVCLTLDGADKFDPKFDLHQG